MVPVEVMWHLETDDLSRVGGEPWGRTRLSPLSISLVLVLLSVELVVLVATGGTTSALMPLVMLPPLLGALRFKSEAETRLWSRGLSGWSRLCPCMSSPARQAR